MVAELKKGRYVYYHCTGAKGRCADPYVREEELEEQFGRLLEGLTFDEEVLAWVGEALREGHADQRRFHDEAVARLQGEQTRLQARLDAMYIDKLDGRIDVGFFDRKAGEWRGEQWRILEAIEAHQTANEVYFDDGVRVLSLARRAHLLFRQQEPREKRRLLDFVISNCTWKDRKLQATYRQPFDLLAVHARVDRSMAEAGTPLSGRTENWLPGLGSNQRLPD
jgi:site-specific DNA recombinase